MTPLNRQFNAALNNAADIGADDLENELIEVLAVGGTIEAYVLLLIAQRLDLLTAHIARRTSGLERV